MKELILKLNSGIKIFIDTRGLILNRWLRLCLKGGWTDVFPLVVAFLLEQGRMKFVRPLYRSVK